jgi:serine/threonine-protein kinase RsbW
MPGGRLSMPGSRWRPGNRGGVLHELEAQLPAAPVSAGTARHLAREVLTDWGLAALTDDVLLVTSELAANAISASQRSRADAIALWLARTPDGLLVAMADPAGAGRLPAQIRLTSPGPVLLSGDPEQVSQLAENGRGLMLAAALTERLGWYRSGKWTVVWAEFSVADDPEPATAEAA